ncbi:MAG: hypothetical protein GDA67_10015 [Nitrospira sp. CR1.3]|nr:hypothetical protein [Nitrospira sp. CR1.3]
MSLEFIGRLQKELSLTGSAVYESVLAIAERVNRKVHILRLHSQAASLLSQIETVQGDLGRRLVGAIPDQLSASRAATVSPADIDRVLQQALGRIQDLKQTLVQVDGQIRELKMETIHEDLLRLQRDLSFRSAALDRLLVAQGSPAVGKSLADLALPSSARLVTVFRGPFLIPPSDAFVFRPDDIAIVIGLRTDLDQVALWFAPAPKAVSA